MASTSARQDQDIDFTIDGEAFSTEAHRQTSRDLLVLAGVDPADYDLGELVGNRPDPKRFADDDDVTVHKGARFVTLRVGPAPVE